MMQINNPVRLAGTKVELVPLEASHIPDLVEVAKEEKIWAYFSAKLSDPAVLTQHLRSALLKRATGEQYAFTVIERSSGAPVGSTMLYNIYPEHRKLEIGFTWYASRCWRTGYNRECKLLLLTYCFEELQTLRVQLQTDENNERSRNAILGIGATFEGILRNERLRADGTIRHTALYSIISSEWAAVKEGLKRGIR